MKTIILNKPIELKNRGKRVYGWATVMTNPEVSSLGNLCLLGYLICNHKEFVENNIDKIPVIRYFGADDWRTKRFSYVKDGKTISGSMKVSCDGNSYAVAKFDDGTFKIGMNPYELYDYWISGLNESVQELLKTDESELTCWQVDYISRLVEEPEWIASGVIENDKYLIKEIYI